MNLRRFFKVLLGILLVIAALGAGGFYWLTQSPIWAGITLFSESKRVENFRAMDEVFPYRTVAASGDVWAFSRDERPLPETYTFNGETRDLAAFLVETMTTGLLVVHGGAITHEIYDLGADETSELTSWSMAKSIVSALIGIAVEEGHIENLSDPVSRYVTELEQTAYGAVSIEDVLTMSSGIGFNEDYDDPFSDVNQLFIGFATGASLTETLAPFESVREPGTYNDYISSDTIALGLVLEAATGETLDAYLQSRLWGPMGAEADAFWSTGRAGDALPLCCMNATLRDYARFGRLFLQGGVRGGQQIIPAGWVEASTKPEAPHLQPGENPASSWTFGYGYQWWIPEESHGDYVAIGIWGQYIYVDPTRDVVIVKTSVDEWFDDHDHESIALFRAIARSVSRSGPTS